MKTENTLGLNLHPKQINGYVLSQLFLSQEVTFETYLGRKVNENDYNYFIKQFNLSDFDRIEYVKNQESNNLYSILKDEIVNLVEIFRNEHHIFLVYRYFRSNNLDDFLSNSSI